MAVFVPAAAEGELLEGLPDDNDALCPPAALFVVDGSLGGPREAVLGEGDRADKAEQELSREGEGVGGLGKGADAGFDGAEAIFGDPGVRVARSGDPERVGASSVSAHTGNAVESAHEERLHEETLCLDAAKCVCGYAAWGGFDGRHSHPQAFLGVR